MAGAAKPYRTPQGSKEEGTTARIEGAAAEDISPVTEQQTMSPYSSLSKHSLDKGEDDADDQSSKKPRTE